jgi:2-oxoglutarate ferredoxin oxidoreductase subunit gamma
VSAATVDGPGGSTVTADRVSLARRAFLEVRFGGSGGQGVILMGVILATAATLDGRHVIQTQSYGPEARGGYSRSDVIVSNQPIDYPEILDIDLLVALSDEAAHHYVELLRPNGVFIYDSQQVPDPPAVRGSSFGVPFSELAVRVTGRVQTANILTLGAVAGLTDIVTRDSLEKAVSGMVPPGTEELNLTAVRAGFEVDAGR